VGWHTHLEPYEREGKKGYLFTMGDERPYETLKRLHVERYIGDQLEADIDFQTIVDKVTERYEWFHLVLPYGYGGFDHALPVWSKYLGERAIKLSKTDDTNREQGAPEAAAETIALAIGLIEGATTIDDGMDDLKDVGFDPANIAAAGKALATIGSGAGGGAVATTSGGSLDLTDGDAGSARL
jgi:hypothetical protein